MPYFKDEDDEQKKEPTAEELLELELYLKVKMFLFDSYQPAESQAEGFCLSTIEVYDKLQDHIPGSFYSVRDVASWLMEAGYKTADNGQMKLEWMMKRKV